jgi:hypothetical protein
MHDRLFRHQWRTEAPRAVHPNRVATGPTPIPRGIDLQRYVRAPPPNPSLQRTRFARR